MSKDELIDEEVVKEKEIPEGESEEEILEEQSDSEDKNGLEEKEDESSRYMRLAADFQNYKRRVDKEKSDIYAYANEKITVDLLEVLDNFERGLEHLEDEGVHLILKQFKDVMAKHDVEEIDSLGEEFDPSIHHAVIMEHSDEYESGKVVEVMQKGYKLKDKVIRPSMVKVSE